MVASGSLWQTEETAAVSVTDAAGVQQLGEVIAATRDFPGIRAQGLAVRVAGRELRALSAPLLAGEITVTRQGAHLGPGDVVRLRSDARLGESDIVCRITEVGQGDGRANGIRLTLAEDVFALGGTPLVGGREPPRPSLARRPRPLTRRMVAEAPWWLTVRELGHAQAEAALAEDPGAGVLVAVAGRPSADAESPQLWVDAGPGPVEEGVGSYAPTALLAADLSADPEARMLAVSDWADIEAVAIGTLAALGDELLRIDGVSPDTLRVGRGCLDTVPQAHTAGTPLVFFDATAGIGATPFAAGETVAVRLLPQTGRGVLPWASAPEDRVTFARRAARPLPAGRVRANGAWLPPAGALLAGEVTLTWPPRADEPGHRRSYRGLDQPGAGGLLRRRDPLDRSGDGCSPAAGRRGDRCRHRHLAGAAARGCAACPRASGGLHHRGGGARPPGRGRDLAPYPAGPRAAVLCRQRRLGWGVGRDVGPPGSNWSALEPRCRPAAGRLCARASDPGRGQCLGRQRLPLLGAFGAAAAGGLGAALLGGALPAGRGQPLQRLHGLVTGEQREDYALGSSPIFKGSLGYRGSGALWGVDGTQKVTGLLPFGAGDVVMLCFEPATAKIWTGVNGIWNHPLSGVPTFTGTPAAAWHARVQGRDPGDGGRLISAAADFAHPLPPGAAPLADAP
jgi:Putative phage tail protein